METTKKELTAADFRVGQRVLINGKAQKVVAVHPDRVSYGFGLRALFSEIKPILRRLKNLPPEYYALCKDYRKLEDEGYYSGWHENTIESVLWLIDNGYDIWGYIEAGLAVDAATLEGEGE